MFIFLSNTLEVGICLLHKHRHTQTHTHTHTHTHTQIWMLTTSEVRMAFLTEMNTGILWLSLVNITFVKKKKNFHSFKFVLFLFRLSPLSFVWLLQDWLRTTCYSNTLYTLREKCYSGLNAEYSVSLRIQSEYGIIRTRITPHTDTFYAVTCLRL